MYVFLLHLSCNDKTSQENRAEHDSLEETVEIYLVELLDEPRGFCLDIRGYKESADPKKGLQAHTCYSYQGSIAVDQEFSLQRINDNEFYMPKFDVCMEAGNANASSDIKLESCSINDLQKFVLDSGNIVLKSNNNLCLTISSENSIQGGGGNPVHLIRDLTLKNCDSNLSKYLTWSTR